jgi:hypothetical protein
MKLVSREPWWARAPRKGQSEIDLDWGYLEIYQNGPRYEFKFVRERPSHAEIVNRKACRTGVFAE